MVQGRVDRLILPCWRGPPPHAEPNIKARAISTGYDALDETARQTPFSPMDPDKEPPLTQPTPKTARELRQEREAAALRANLRKRKDQARAREEEAADEKKAE